MDSGDRIVLVGYGMLLERHETGTSAITYFMRLLYPRTKEGLCSLKPFWRFTKIFDTFQFWLISICM